jgi:hypothetical protein
MAEVHPTRKFLERETVLTKAEGDFEEQAERLKEWIEDRIEQHDVLGDDVGSLVDYELLVLVKGWLSEAISHFETCVSAGWDD